MSLVAHSSSVWDCEGGRLNLGTWAGVGIGHETKIGFAGLLKRNTPLKLLTKRERFSLFMAGNATVELKADERILSCLSVDFK